MKITVRPIKIKENPMNEVTSEKVFKSRKIKDPVTGEYLFDEDGIFSERIFGKFGHCKCGLLTHPGICEACGCRVLDKRRMPNFYIKFDFDLPNWVFDKSCDDEYNFDKETLDMMYNLLYYKGFIYKGKGDEEDLYVEFDLKKDMSVFEEDRILIGKDALFYIEDSEDIHRWYERNTHRLISIPHTKDRKITFQNGKRFLGQLNQLYIKIIRQKLKYEKYAQNSELTILNELNIRYVTCECLEKLNKNLFQILAKNKRNIIANELRGQPQTGMIRAVMTNNSRLHEDTLILGKWFIKTLYPKIYEDCTDKATGVTDIDKVNKILEDGNYLVLLNRQPTIGAKSFLGMKPVFSDKESEKYVIQTNPIIYDGLAADVDGDTLNVYSLYTKKACKEAEKLMPSKNYVEGSNTSIRNGLLEEYLYIEYLLKEDRENASKE